MAMLRRASKKTLLSRRDHALFGLHRIVLCAVAVFLVTLFCHPGWSQTAIKIVMPAPAGGAGDVVARMLTEQVSQAQGRAMVIENRAGAGTIIGTEAVARAAPDGNTLLITAPYLVIAPHLRKLNFDPLTSFEPICHLVSSPGVIVANSASPYRTLADFVPAGRADVRCGGARYRPACRVRDAQARRQRKPDLRPLYRGCAGDHRAIGRTCNGSIRRVRPFGRAPEVRQAAGDRDDDADPDRLAAG